MIKVKNIILQKLIEASCCLLAENSKLLDPIVYFAETVQTTIWAVRAEQPWFLPHTVKEGNDCTSTTNYIREAKNLLFWYTPI